jgi:hypothetical protein
MVSGVDAPHEINMRVWIINTLKAAAGGCENKNRLRCQFIARQLKKAVRNQYTNVIFR